MPVTPRTPHSVNSPWELDAFLLKKWEHAFSIFFDMNKDNQLEWADFELLIKRIKDCRGIESDEYKTALISMKNIWKELSGLADIDSDNQVSTDEWKHMWYSTIRNDMDAAWQKMYLDYMFRLFDATGDDVIDMSEYIEVMGYYGIERKQAIWAFDKFALGPEGQQVNAINYDRYCALWKEYFTTADPTKPGNFLFGDVTGEFDPSKVIDTPEDSEDEEYELES